MNKITRIDSNERLSKVVIHGDTIYIAALLPVPKEISLFKRAMYYTR